MIAKQRLFLPKSCFFGTPRRPEQCSSTLWRGSGNWLGVSFFAFFESRIRFLDLGSTFWPGDLFGVKKWSRKNDFVMEWFCHGNSGEIPRPKSILLSIGPIWAGYFVPKPPYLVIFKGLPIFRKTGERPGSAPLYIPYSPLWDPYSLLTPDIPPWWAAMLCLI